MKKLIGLMISFVLLLTVTTTSVTFAQSPGGQGGSYTNTGSTDTNGTIGTTTQSDNNGFNPMWLLPLLAIPLLFLLFRKGNNDDRGYDRNSGLAGMKGGRADRRNTDNSEEVV